MCNMAILWSFVTCTIELYTSGGIHRIIEDENAWRPKHPASSPTGMKFENIEDCIAKNKPK